MFIDSHNHLTPWSRDAVQSREDLLASAKKNGLFGVGISDHYDIGSYTPDGLEWVFDIKDYLKTFVPYKKTLAEARKSDELSFSIGIELGYLPEYEDRLKAIMEEKDFDYFIFSLHCIDGACPGDDAHNFFTGSLQEDHERALEASIKGLTQFPDVHIFAHFDYTSRYAPECKSKMLYRDFPDHFDRLFSLLIEEGIALEINTGTIDYLRRRGYEGLAVFPDEEIIKRFLDLGGELLTISSDTHGPVHHRRPIRETLEFLRSCGVKKLAYFENQKVCTHPI